MFLGYFVLEYQLQYSQQLAVVGSRRRLVITGFRKYSEAHEWGVRVLRVVHEITQLEIVNSGDPKWISGFNKYKIYHLKVQGNKVLLLYFNFCLGLKRVLGGIR